MFDWIEEFMNTMNKWFAILDFVKSQRASKGKDIEEKLKITNE